MNRYDYECEACGRMAELALSMKSSPRRKRKCPACGAMKLVRQIAAGMNTTLADVAKARLFNKYPVVSNRLPFDLQVPGVEVKHAGPLKKAVIESRAHERRVYDAIGATRGD